MVILALADTEVTLSELPAASLVICLGDLSNKYLEGVRGAAACPVFGVQGNHDGSKLPPGISPLHGQVQSFGGLDFGGLSGCLPYKVFPHGYSQGDAEAILVGLGRVDVLCSHNSPAGIHDHDNGVHTGYHALNSYMRLHRPSILLHGHQHIRQRTRVGETTVFGVFGYALIETLPVPHVVAEASSQSR